MFSLTVLVYCGYIVSLCTGFVMPDRDYSKVLTVNNGGQYGDWGPPEFCLPGTYVSGYSMKLETTQFAGDDTALNAIRLLCSDKLGHHDLTHQLTSLGGPYGTWTKEVTCNQNFGEPMFMTSFRMQVEAPQENGDDTSANFVIFRCRELDNPSSNGTTTSVWPGHGIWGTWSDWSASCGMNQAICGMSTKVQTNQGSGDDTALNDVKFYCCA